MLAKLFILFIKLYQKIISPILHFLLGPLIGCRFRPSCSQYYIDSLKYHGFFKGNFLGIWRLLRCNPWGGYGEDPVIKK